jgi:hypothetical protein
MNIGRFLAIFRSRPELIPASVILFSLITLVVLAWK